MTKKFTPSKRILELPPYLFKEIDDKKRTLISQGKTLLNMGIGDPDLPTPSFITETMNREMGKNENQKYPAYEGCHEFRKAVAVYMKERFGVEVNPDTEVVALIGSKEGLAHFNWAFVDPGDVTIVPDPGYPVYKTTTIFSGGEPFALPLRETNGFFPDFSEIPAKIASRAKILYLNYPNNPTGAVATRDQLTRTVEWATKNQVIVAYDAAYAEMTYDQSKRLSFLAIPGAREVGVEFHSFSKTFNMTGWRIGFAVGNAKLVTALLKMKTNVDSGVFTAVQLACAEGLRRIGPHMDDLVGIYRERRDTLISILKKYNWGVFNPEGAFYVLAKCPKGVVSKDWTIRLLEQTGIVTTPGSGFGAHGEGYVRFALTQPVEVIREMDQRLGKILT